MVHELIGRSDLLDMRKGLAHWKAKGLDFSRVFHQPKLGPDVARYQVEEQDHRLNKALDIQLIEKCRPAIERGEKVQILQEVRNGKITRDEAVKLVQLYDQEFPAKFFDYFLEYIDMSPEEFWQTVDSFRSPHLWVKEGDQWRLRHQVT